MTDVTLFGFLVMQAKTEMLGAKEETIRRQQETIAALESSTSTASAAAENKTAVIAEAMEENTKVSSTQRTQDVELLPTIFVVTFQLRGEVDSLLEDVEHLQQDLDAERSETTRKEETLREIAAQYEATKATLADVQVCCGNMCLKFNDSDFAYAWYCRVFC